MKGYKLLSINATAGLLLMLAFFIPQLVMAQAPTYQSMSVVAGGNIQVPPNALIGFTVTEASAIAARPANGNFFMGAITVDGTGLIRVADARPAGTYDFDVEFVSSTGSIFQSTFQLTVTDPGCTQGRFLTGTTVSVINEPYGLVVGDFDNDGIQDLIAGSSLGVDVNGTQRISTRKGLGNGTFSTLPDITGQGWGIFALAAGDFDGDGNLDLVSASSGHQVIRVLLGDGNFNFTQSASISNSNYRRLAVADFNADGNLDIAATAPANGGLWILLGNGNGTFGSPTVLSIPGAGQIAIGYFNNDIYPDMAVGTNPNSTKILLGSSTGSFTAGQTLNIGVGGFGVATADFDLDGFQDLVIAGINNTGNNRARFAQGDGNGNFVVSSTNLGLGDNTTNVVVGDFNGDGKPDFATSNGSISEYLGNGDGTFTAVPAIAEPGWYAPATTVIGDFNGDGKQDLATTHNHWQNNFIGIHLGGANEIDVLGNSVSIADGSTSPLTTNHTDFGVVATNSSLARTYTISNTGNTALTIPTGGITLTGTDASMFVLSGITLPATIAAGGTSTFVVTFTPTSQGAKTVTLNVANNDCDEAPYNFALRGGQVCDFSTCVGKTLTFNATNSGASYAWSFGDAGTSTAQNPSHAYTAPGQYTVTFQLTDVNGCVTSNSQVVCVYDAPVVTNTSLNPLCNGATNGSIDVAVTGGAPGTTFTYIWSNGATTEDLSNVGAGTYTVTVTDGTTTCFSTLSVTLTEPVVLAAAATVGTNVLCFGAATGTATASATGGTNPYTYAWSNGQTVANATGLAAGAYTVTVTDANGCTTTASVTITQPAAALAATETHTNVGCFGASTGAIDLTVTGGTSAYTYLWSNNATTEDLSGLAAGTCTVTVTDANGCSTTASATVGQPASALAVAPSNSGNVCQAGSNSNLLSNATGGTPGYTYLWTPGNVTTQDVNNVGAGTYNVTVTDANGCTATGSTTVGTFPGTPANFIISH